MQYCLFILKKTKYIGRKNHFLKGFLKILMFEVSIFCFLLPYIIKETVLHKIMNTYYLHFIQLLVKHIMNRMHKTFDTKSYNETDSFTV